MTQEINRQELIWQLRRLFGFQGSTGFELGETVFPVASLGDLDSPPFHSKIGGCASTGVGPIAAQYAYSGLIAPQSASPSFRAVIRRCMLSSNGTSSITIKVVNTVDLQTAIGAGVQAALASSWDSLPGGGTIRPQLVQFTHNSAVSYGTANDGYSFINVAGIAVEIDHPFVLAPGNTLLVQGGALNNSLNTSFLWDEYYLG